MVMTSEETTVFNTYYNLGPNRSIVSLQSVINAGVGAGLFSRKYTLMELDRLSREEKWEDLIHEREASIEEKTEARIVDAEVSIRETFLEQKKERMHAINVLRTMGIRLAEDIVLDIDGFRKLNLGGKLKHLPSICKVLELASNEERKELDLPSEDLDRNITPDDIIKGLSDEGKKLVRAQLGL